MTDYQDLLSALTRPSGTRTFAVTGRMLHAHQGAYAGGVVMVTGAGGSIGAELCHQLAQGNIRTLVLFEQNELALYTIEQSLTETASAQGFELVAVLGSVSNAQLVQDTLRTHAVDTIFHAAAYKHVPLVERNPIAGLSNNVMGTRVLAAEAKAQRVARFVLISSDKAVRPANVMGASKRFAEMIAQDHASRPSHTVFSIVRFGNVLGSSGSVLPLFEGQIAKGGPVTLTHDDATRYFMTPQEAAQLVLAAGGMARGGELFMLDMGPPISVQALARQMIKDAGLRVRDADTPSGDIEIEVTGLREGEKLHEELSLSQTRTPTRHHRILQVKEPCLSELELAATLRALEKAIAQNDATAARDTITRWIAADRMPSCPAAQIGKASNGGVLKF